MPRADGRLTHEVDPHDIGPQDACGVFGVWAPGEEAAKLTYFGLYALQHRGQQSAGIAVSDSDRILVYKDMGLVSQVFDEAKLESLPGHLAIGHTRYSASSTNRWERAQPTFRPVPSGSIALAHNGNLTNLTALKSQLGPDPSHDSDTGVIAGLLATHPEQTTYQALADVLAQLRGAFSLVLMDDHTLYAARDPQGVRPLVLGRLERGWVVASESAALDIIGASYIREVRPGELVAIDAEGLRSQEFAAPAPKGCLFEFVYLARPDSKISQQRVHSVRVDIGRKLAREHPIDADLVIPVPESGTPAAIGYAEESHIPFGHGLVKN